MPQEYETFAERREREQLEEMRLRLGNQLNVDYEKANDVKRLSGLTGLPDDLIEADFDNISELVRERDFDPNKYKDEAPEWRKFASEHPMNLAVLKHDEDSMTRYERAYRELDSTNFLEAGLSHVRDTVRSGIGPTANALKSSWASNERLRLDAIQQQNKVPDAALEERIKELRKYEASHDFGAEWSKPIVWLAKESGNMVYSGYRRAERGAQYAVVGAGIGGAYGAAGGTFVLPVVGTTVGAGAGALALGGIFFTGGALTGSYEAGLELGRGEAYREYKDLGFNHQDSVWASEISGHMSATLEATLGNIFFDKLPGVRAMRGKAGQEIVKQLMGDRTFREVAGRAAFDYGASVTGEVVTEIGQEAGLIVMGEVLKERTPGVAAKLTSGEITSRIAEVAVETLKAVFIIGGAGAGQRLIMDGRRARNAENFSTVLKELADGVQKTDMRQNLPDAWKSFVDRVKEGGSTESIGMPVQEFIDFWQTQGVDPDTAAKNLGIDPEKMESARLLGHDVKIPWEAFVERIAGNSETFNQMLPNLRPHEDALTWREAQKYVESRDRLMGILEDGSDRVRATEDDADIETIVQDVQTQLIGAGYDEFGAGQLAQIMRGIGVMAQREGQDVVPMYEQIFGGVKRTTEGAATQGEDVSAKLDPLLNKLREGDFPTQQDMLGPSLLDFIVEAGGIDIGDPELVAMDFGIGVQELGVSKARVARWKKEGKEVSAIAELAAEAGYLSSADEKLLIEGLREEIAGRGIYGSEARGDPEQQELNSNLNQLSDYLRQAGIDINTMTNAEIRRAMSERQTLAQIDTKDLQDLTKSIMSQVGLSEQLVIQNRGKPFIAGQGPVDTTLARALAMMPLVDEQQDFGDLTIPAIKTIKETGKKVLVEEAAQVEFRQAVKRKNLMNKLLDCLSG